MTISPKELRRQPELKVLALAEGLAAHLFNALAASPKIHRYRMVAHIESRALTLIDLVISAAESNQLSKVYRLQEHIRAMHSVLRIATQAGAIKAGVGGPASMMLQEIGAITSSWRAKLEEKRKK